MWRIDDGEASESAKGICTMRFDARFCRHASLVCLAFLVSDQRTGAILGLVHHLHRRTYSARPVNRPVWPAEHAGESGDKSRGRLSSEMMTDAQ